MPSHVDASIIYVPIMPETSGMDSAMEKVGKDATESFGKGSSGIGDKIHDSISKSKDKLKDVFHRSGSDASEAMAEGVKQGSSKVEDAIDDVGTKATHKFNDATKGFGKVLVNAIGPDTQKLLGDKLEETVGGALEGVLGDNSKLAGKFAHTVADWGFEELKNKLGDVQGAAEKTKKAFASFKDGDTIGGVSKLVEGFDKLGIGVKDLPEPIRGVIGDISDAKGVAEDFAGIFKDLPGRVGAVGSAIENLAGPISIAAAAAMEIWNGLPGIGGGLNQILNSPTSVDTSPEKLGLGVPNSVSVQTPASIMALPGQPQPVAAGSIPAGGQGHEYIATQGSLDPFAALLPPGMAPPDLSKPSPLAPVDMPDGTSPPMPVAPAPVAPSKETIAPPKPVPNSFVSSMPSVSSQSDLRAGGSRIANLYRVAQSLEGTPYSQALRNDCCLVGSSMVYGPNGAKPISELQPGDEVYAYSDGSAVSRKVVAAWQSITQPVFRVRTRNRSVVASANHPFMVVREIQDCAKRPAQYGIEWARLDELQRGDLLVQPRALTLRDADAELPDGTPVTEDVAWLLGAIIGDGTVSPPDAMSRNILLCLFGDKRERAIEIIKANWTRQRNYATGRTVHVRRSESAGLAFNHSGLADALWQMGFSHRGPEKRIPSSVWTWGEKLQRAFLNGYCDADGYRPTDVVKHGERSYASCSQRLIGDIRSLHIILGDRVSNVTVNRRVKPIVINGHRVRNALPLHSFSVYLPSPDYGEARFKQRPGLVNWLDDNDFTISKVLGIADEGIADTYDIEVEEDHNFIADGIVVHNSGMVSKLATAALGMSPSVQFSTANEGDWLMSHGFQPGQGPAGSLQVGWYDHGGGNAGHTAATLPDGTNAEAGGSHGNFILGSGAAGANDPQFTNHAWLPMDGSIPGGSGRNRPVGDEHDPLYVTQTAGANGSGGSDMQNQGQQLGSGLLDGLAQSVGLDGSVFKGFGGASNPAHFGITKLATGLLNWGAGQVQGGDGASLGGGGGGGGIPGLGMLSGLMSHGAAASANTVPIGPGGAQNVRTGETTTHNYNDNSFTVNQSGVQGSGVQDWQHANNSTQNRTGAMTVNNGGNLPGQ